MIRRQATLRDSPSNESNVRASKDINRSRGFNVLIILRLLFLLEPQRKACQIKHICQNLSHYDQFGEGRLTRAIVEI